MNYIAGGLTGQALLGIAIAGVPSPDHAAFWWMVAAGVANVAAVWRWLH